MLLVIIGLAVIVTMLTTGQIAEQERLSGQGASSTNDGSSKQIVYSRTLIPAGSKIESKEVEVRGTSDLNAWEDAATSTSELIGSTAKHSIPAHAQIRKIDLE